MATRYDFIYQVCEDAAGEQGHFVLNIPVWVYGTAEYQSKTTYYEQWIGTERESFYRYNPTYLTTAGHYILDNFPHIGNGNINIASIAEMTHEWYDQILHDIPNMTPLKTGYFYNLPNDGGATFLTATFYLKRLIDGQVFGPFTMSLPNLDGPSAVLPPRPTGSMASSLPFFTYGAGSGGWGQDVARHGMSITGLYIVKDDFDGTISDEMEIHLSSVDGYLSYTPQCGTTYADMFSHVITNANSTFLRNTPPLPPTDDDPYSQGGNSDTGGGTGNFDLSSDAIDFPALPSLTAVSTGLVTVYKPTLQQLNDLADYMWNANATDIDWWKKLVADPLDLILGLSIVPVAVPAGATNNVKVGLIDTGISMTRAASQFVEVDCGSINVQEYWGSALDYSPFRRFSIYLPFIGTRTISTDDIMGKTVHVKYHIDLLSGACTAMVKCGDAVLYQYSGACAVSLPLTGETFTNVITSTIQLAASIGATVATGGAAAGVSAASAANSLMSMKPIVERAGGVSGAAGQLGVMYPYLIGEIPRQSVPQYASKFMGYPSNIFATIGELSGFTSIEIIHLENISATEAEKAELETILKAGVIL